ncbi:MAG TPA: L-histidine N(alpha)-methyltransferase [Kofleriaceae bacterium]|nr:L-histidine N(alpha)-methyltransferase [Kofleriaceae bacterium]
MTVSHLPLRTNLLEDDVLAGLAAPKKHLPCRLLYDAQGAELFESIMRVDDYYPTRTELELLGLHLPQLAQAIGRDARVIEPGCGDGTKTRMLLRGLDRPSSYVGIDVAREQLGHLTHGLRVDMPDLDVQGLVADYTQPFVLPTPQHGWKKSVVFFPGSTIGNFEPNDARSFLSMLGQIAGDERLLLLGADGTREVSTLLRAYDDPLGVTAEFNKNVLRRLNRERGATFDLDCFEHRAVWNAEHSRVEMHLVSTCRQIVRVDNQTVAFTAGESIVTEHCYKHSPMAMQAILGGAGWRPRQVFTSAQHPYRLWLCEPIVYAR